MKGRAAINTIDIRKEVVNLDRKFGSDLYYIPVTIIDRDGVKRQGLMTHSQLDVAIERARQNPEDLPKRKSFWQKLKDLI